MQADRNYYRILRLKMGATENEIEEAYRLLAGKYHPDVYQAADAQKIFQLIEEAYQVLGDSEKKRTYDRMRRSLGYDVPSALRLKLVSSHEKLSNRSKEQALYLLLDISAAKDIPTSRLPLNLAIVLDRSTSMQGDRLKQAKQATYDIIERLLPGDSLSLITFSDRAQVLLPSQINVDKAVARAALSTVQAAGGTEIFQGLDLGLKQLEKQRQRASVNHLILLTDGQTYGDEALCLDKSRWAGRHQISLSTMGLGEEWNESLLEEMASLSSGTSTYIDSPQRIVDTFSAAMETLTTIIARDMALHFISKPSVVLQEAFQIKPYLRRLDIRANQVKLGPLGRLQDKQLLLELRVAGIGAKGKTPLGRLKVSGDIPQKLQHRNWLTRDLFTEFVAQPPKPDIPRSIVETLRRLMLFKVQEKAMEDIEQGELESATQRLNNLATHLLNLGEKELSQMALSEARNISRTGTLTDLGRKKIYYGTRMLAL